MKMPYGVRYSAALPVCMKAPVSMIGPQIASTLPPTVKVPKGWPVSRFAPVLPWTMN